MLLGMTSVYGIEKTRIFIVSSYHREYLWSQETARGINQAMLDSKMLDNTKQANTLIQSDHTESSKVIIQKAWMDTKHKNSKSEIADSTAKIVDLIENFKPDIILLGDDNAANYIGNHFIDTNIPVVFWGINGLPLKYGLIDQLEKPGHNVTGIYQAGYIKENIEYLKRLVPSIETIGVLSDDSPTGRAKVKEIEQLAQAGKLPVKVVGSVMTNSYEQWKEQALKLNEMVDAFVVFNHNTLKDEQGQPVEQMTAGAWYLENIKKPDCSHERQFAQEGILLVVDDSGYKQGYEAAMCAIDIIHGVKQPATTPVKAPQRGPVILNRQRAKMLGLDLKNVDFIEEYIDEAMALQKN